jgi:predicted kinase
LGNIVVHGGQPLLFDAIEFNDVLAHVDVLYDLAFLVMDLESRGLPMLASILLNRYLDNTGDDGGLAAMGLFLSLRAQIRSHVDAARAGVAPAGPDAERWAEAARHYLCLAARCLEPAVPRLIALGGLSGSGKSRLARALAPAMGAPPGARIVRTDVLRKRLSGVPLGTRLPAVQYGPEMTRRTYDALFREAARALRAGSVVIADAVFAQPDERQAIARVAEAAGVPFHGLWLEAPARLLEERVSRRRHNVSDATPAVVRMQLGYDLGAIDWVKMDTSGSAEETLALALDRLQSEITHEI